MGYLLADHAARADRGAGSRRRGGETRLRDDDDHAEDRRRSNRSGATRGMSAMGTERIKGPASYFPSIEKTSGRPIREWQDLVRDHPSTGRASCWERVGTYV